MHKAFELLFSYGSSKCLGYEMVMSQFAKILSEVSSDMKSRGGAVTFPNQYLCSFSKTSIAQL